MGYYLYLPAQFIYHDLGRLTFIPDIMREYAPSGSFYQAFQVPGGPEGQLVMKYACGLAVLWTPFFWLGHWAAGWLSYPQDGFSAPYQIAIAFGGLLYGLMGLGLLRRVLLWYFSDAITTVVLVLLVLGSNYFQYAVFDAAMTHSPLFSLYALLLWLTGLWHTKPSRIKAAGIGLTLGLLVLIRPSEVVAVVIPLLWGVTGLATARAKLALALQRWPDLALLVVAGIVGLLPQLLYWKWATGHFLFYSYGEQKFSFLQPHVYQVLFSYRKGWLIYSPLLLMPLIGFVFLWRKQRSIAVPILTYFVLNFWVVSAWDIWWYGGSFGQRALVQSYAALALPWGAAVAWLAGQRLRLHIAVAVGVLLITLNLFQHWQYMRSIIDPEEMNRRYYWAVFNKTMPTQLDYTLLDVKTHLPKSERHYTPRVLSKLDFENQASDSTTHVSADLGYFSRQSYHADAAYVYSPTISLRLADAGLTAGQYIRASCRVFSDYGAWGNKLVMTLERDNKPVVWNGVRLQNNLSISRAWNHIYFDAPLPDDAQPNDILKVYVLSENSSSCYIDDIQAELFEPKTQW
ncbi:hypothetical protein [Hymenobacter sp. B1770]|uniref:hypothetical protein n=1 Tax=Hymenobacter sp. B1770 TaxID=1718788 RepID=UPI003CF336FB